MNNKHHSSNENILKKGMLVYISHLSVPVPLLSIVQETEGNYITLSLSKHVSNIALEDPVVCKFLEDGHEFVLTGDITDIYGDDTIRVLVTNISKHHNNRKHTRFAVSLIAVVVGDDSLDYNCATVKSISYSGVAFNCKVEYDVGTSLIINIIISADDVINGRSKIVRKRKVLEYNEYGLEFIYFDDINKEKLEKYLKKLKEDEKNFIKSISK